MYIHTHTPFFFFFFFTSHAQRLDYPEREWFFVVYVCKSRSRLNLYFSSTSHELQKKKKVQKRSTSQKIHNFHSYNSESYSFFFHSKKNPNLKLSDNCCSFNGQFPFFDTTGRQAYSIRICQHLPLNLRNNWSYIHYIIYTCVFLLFQQRRS